MPHSHNLTKSPSSIGRTVHTHAQAYPRYLSSGISETEPRPSYKEHYKQWQHIEALEARLHEVQATFRESEFASLLDSSAPAVTLRFIEDCILRLESRLGIAYDVQEPTPHCPYRCPAENCHRVCQTQTLFYQHIRRSKGAGHRALQAMIERKFCLPCDRDFLQLQGQMAHERIHYTQFGEERKGCRVANFLP